MSLEAKGEQHLFRERLSGWEQRTWSILSGPLFRKENQLLTDDQIRKLPHNSVDSLMHALDLRVYKASPSSVENSYIIKIPTGFLKREERILGRTADNHVIPVQEAIIHLRKTLISKQSPILPDTIEIVGHQGRYEARVQKSDGSFLMLFPEKKFPGKEDAQKAARRMLGRFRQ